MEILKIKSDRYNRITEACKMLSCNVNGCRNQEDEEYSLTVMLIKRYSHGNVDLQEYIEKHKTITVVHEQKYNAGTNKWGHYINYLAVDTLKGVRETACYIKDAHTSVKKDNIRAIIVK